MFAVSHITHKNIWIKFTEHGRYLPVCNIQSLDKWVWNEPDLKRKTAKQKPKEKRSLVNINLQQPHLPFIQSIESSIRNCCSLEYNLINEVGYNRRQKFIYYLSTKLKMVLICWRWTVRIVPERRLVSRKFIARFTRNSFVLFLLTQNSCFHSTSTQPKILTNYYSQYCSAFPSFTITESQHFWFSFYSCGCSSWNYFCATFPIHKIFYRVDWIKDDRQ